MKTVVFELDNKGSDKTKYDVHFHTVETNNTNITLCQSQYDQSWTDPGTIEAKLYDHGNGITITLDNGQVLDLDYSQAAAVRMLLHASDMASAEKSPRSYPTTLNKFLPYKG